jgi:hypothetical protein
VKKPGLPQKMRAVVSILRFCLILLSALPFRVNAQTTHGAQAYWPTGEWRRATPEAQGLNAQSLASLVNRIRQRQIRDLDSLLIVRNGYLVVEEYFSGLHVAVEYAGPQGAFAGLDQVNLRLPRQLTGRGEVSLALLVDGKAAMWWQSMSADPISSCCPSKAEKNTG